MNSLLGAIAAPARADLDPRGVISEGDDRLEVWVGADDGWHVLAPGGKILGDGLEPDLGLEGVDGRPGRAPGHGMPRWQR